MYVIWLPPAAVCSDSKAACKTRAALYPQSYPDLTAESLGTIQTMANYHEVVMNAI